MLVYCFSPTFWRLTLNASKRKMYFNNFDFKYLFVLQLTWSITTCTTRFSAVEHHYPWKYTTKSRCCPLWTFLKSINTSLKYNEITKQICVEIKFNSIFITYIGWYDTQAPSLNLVTFLLDFDDSFMAEYSLPCSPSSGGMKPDLGKSLDTLFSSDL